MNFLKVQQPLSGTRSQIHEDVTHNMKIPLTQKLFIFIAQLTTTGLHMQCSESGLNKRETNSIVFYYWDVEGTLKPAGDH